MKYLVPHFSFLPWLCITKKKHITYGVLIKRVNYLSGKVTSCLIKKKINVITFTFDLQLTNIF